MAERKFTEQEIKININKFLESYRHLSPLGKETFERQINNQIEALDSKTKKLYQALIEAAKKGVDQASAFKNMQKASTEGS